MEVAIPVFTSLCDQEMGMGVKVDFLSEGLDGGHPAGAKFSAGCGLEVFNPPDVLSTNVVSKRQGFTSLKNGRIEKGEE